MTSNQFDLLGDVDNADDPSQLIAAAEKKAAAAAKPAPAAAKPAAKLPTKPPPPGQAVGEARNFRDGAGRGRGGRGGRNGPRREYGDADANGFEGGHGGGGGGGGGGFGGGAVARSGEDGEGRGRGPRQPYRGGGGRRGGYTEGQTADEFGRPHRSYERRSGTGRGYGMKRDGAGRGNWGTATDEGLPQENVDAINPEETAAVVAEDEKKPEDAPEAQVEKAKEGAENQEEEKEDEDKEMTLEEYEKVLEEKRKALLALKAEERKVEVDKELQSMQQLSVKKDADEVFIKLGADKELKKKESSEREERAKKSLSINEFLKPAEGERYNSPGGRGRGRGPRGRGELRGGYNGGGARQQAPAPAIEDQAQFPTLGGK